MYARMLRLLLTFLLTLAPAPALAVYPVLDGFGIHNAGSVSISGTGIKAIAVQPWDARIIIGGDFSLTGGSPSITRYNLARINPDGTLDSGFNPPTLDGAVRAIALEPDPSAPSGPPLIVIGGSFSQAGGVPRNGLARLKSADGSLDPFNPATSAAPVRVNALALLPDGRGLLVGGSFGELAAGVPSPNLARVSLDAPDPGAAAWSYSAGLDGAVNAIALQGDRILVAGEFGAPRPNLARLEANGTLDGTLAAPAPGGAVFALTLQADGKILMGGGFSGGALAKNYLARLAGDGSPEAGFSPGPNGAVTSILVRPDGKIVIGGDFTQVGASAAGRLARLSLAGVPEATLFPALDAAVRVVAAQPDGKLLAGGDFSVAGAKPRTRLARCYPGGALDDDLAAANLALDMAVTSAFTLPDGSTTLGGVFTQVQGKPRVYLARVREDWNLVDDAAFDPTLRVNGPVNVMLPLPDQSLLVAGNFMTVNGALQRLVVRLDPRGFPNGTPSTTTFNANMKTLMTGTQLMAMTPLPRGSQLPDGTPLEEGMIYLGGNLSGTAPYRYLSRFKDSGLRDTSFTPAPEVNGAVYTMALLPDHKLLVGTSTGRLLRLKSNGELDAALTSTLGAVISIVQQKDGQLLVSGSSIVPRTEPGYDRTLVRMAADGTVEEGFRVETMVSLNGYTPNSYIARVALQTDGSMLIYGVFDHVKGSDGNGYVRDCVARLRPDGTVDPDFDLGMLSYHSGSIIGQLNTVHLQTDGKIVVGGDFDAINLTSPKRLARYSNGWAAQSLTVAPDGTAVSWQRSGTGPELREVWFEHCEEPEAPGAVWSFLGYAQRAPGGWRLDGLDLSQFGLRTNRYLRARGYVAGDKGFAGTVVENVLLYYLDPPQQTVITVTAEPQAKHYGDPDPALGYSFTPALAPGDSFSGALSRAPGEAVGSYPIGQGALALGPGYTLSFAGANLAITPREITVTAQDLGKIYGDPDPPLGYSFSPPLLGSDGFSGALRRAAGESVAGGPYPIQQGTLSLGGNYAITFLPARFEIRRRNATLRAEAQGKSYGAADPPLTTWHAGLLPGDLGAGRITLSAFRSAGEDAGSYPITPAASDNGTGLLANYLCSELAGSFSIAKAPLSVAAEDKTRAYLTPNPQFTARYQGFVRGEDSSVLSGAPGLSSAADLASPVGVYPIVATQGTLAAANYSFILGNGSLNVVKSCQEIIFPPPGDRTYGDPPFAINASACSGLDLSFTSSNPQVASISGNLATITGAGSVVITASQGGTSDLDRAGDVTQTVLVHRAGQTVSFAPLDGRLLGDPPFALNATASSGLPVGYLSSDPAVAEVAGNLVTLKGAGTTVITARQPGNGNYNAALPVSQPLSVALETAPPHLLLSTLAPGAVTANPVLNVAGSAGDASGIASLTVNGARLGDQAECFTSAVLLAPGSNSIEVAALDGAGNRSSQTFSVTLDLAAPQISLLTPADNSVTDSPQLLASGRVPAGSLVQVALNGSAPQTLPVSNGAFSWNGSLAPGTNTVAFSAQLAGRSSQLKRSITLAPGRPSLAILEPPEDLRTEQGSLTIRGSAGGGATRVTLEVGGSSYTPALEAGSFQQTVTLERTGEYRIRARASAADGTASLSGRNVIRVERLLGDLDGDGCVDLKDAAAALRVSLGVEQADARMLAHGDLAPLMDGVPRPDGVIDAGDVLVILRKIVGLVDF